MSQTISAQEFVNGRLGAMHKLTIGNWQSEVLNSSMNNLLSSFLGPQSRGNQAGRAYKRRFDFRDASPLLRQRKRRREGDSGNSVAAITQELLSSSGVEEVQEEVQGDLLEDLPEEVQGDLPGEVQGGALEDLPGEVLENLPGEGHENLPGEVLENLPGEVLGESVQKPFLADHIRQVLSDAENLQTTGKTKPCRKSG